MLARRSIAVLVAFFAVSGLAFGQQPAPKAVTGTVQHDFGRVTSGAILEIKFKIGNEGSAPLRVGNLRLSGKGVSVRLQQQVGPGETDEVIAKIDTSTLVGDWQWSITFNTNDKTRPQIKYDLQAYVYLPVEVSPRRLFFSLFEDQTAKKIVDITNHLDRPLAIKRVEPKGSHFAAALETVEAGKIYRLIVTVPKATRPGRYRETVTLHTDDPERPMLHVAVNVLVKRDVSVTPEEVDFGSVPAARVKLSAGALALMTQTILVKKRDADFTVTGIETDLPFLTVETEPKGRAGTFKLSIGLDPDKFTSGKFSGSLKIKTDDPRFPEITVPVSGEIR